MTYNIQDSCNCLPSQIHQVFLAGPKRDGNEMDERDEVKIKKCQKEELPIHNQYPLLVTPVARANYKVDVIQI